MRMGLVLACLAATFGTASAGTIVFQDNYSSGAPSTLDDFTTIGSLFSGANFSLTMGSIDLLTGSDYGWLCQGTATYCIDTTGTALNGQPNPGQIESVAITFPSAGTYVLSFDLFGWNDTQNGGGPQTAQVNVALGTPTALGSLSKLDTSGCPGCLVYQTYNTDGNIPFSGPTTVGITVTDPTVTYNLVFTDTGNDSALYAGGILDNIEIQTTPEPASMLLVGGPMIGLGLMLRRRR